MTRNEENYIKKINEQQDIIDGLKKQLEALQAPKTCDSCVYIGLNQCRLVREVEIVSGLCGDGYIEIDNPSIYFCADYEPKETTRHTSHLLNG